MGFASVRSLAEAAAENGREWTSWFHKTSGPTGFGAGRWADMSMGAGTPKYNAYVGSQQVATPLIGAGNDGIFAGPTPAPGMTRHLHMTHLFSGVSTLAPSSWFLLDYLMFYPLIDGDSTDQQDMDNTAILPRYSDGQVMLVCTTPTSADTTGTMIYTNQAGVTGRSVSFGISFSGATGCILCAHNTVAGTRSPFLPLANGDSGVRAIESITLAGSAGGFFAAVIVKPLTTIALRENLVPCEMTELIHKGRAPEIKTGAYLNFIYCPMGGAQNAFPLRGFLQFAWS